MRIVPSSIGFIPDIYENEVRSLIWAKQKLESSSTLAAIKDSSSAFPGRPIKKSIRRIPPSERNKVADANSVIPKLVTLSLQGQEAEHETLDQSKQLSVQTLRTTDSETVDSTNKSIHNLQ